MIIVEERTFVDAYGVEVSSRWWPTDDPRGVVLVAHGASEHGGRYDRFARALNDAGLAAYALDHRGHGETASGPDDLGVFPSPDGWGTVVRDLLTVTRHAKAAHPDVPFVLFGHSMGSLLARTYVLDHADQVDALVLSGTAGDPGAVGRAGHAVALVESRLRGRDTASPLMDRLTFGSFNAKFQPARTRFDWISRDTDVVDAYIDDPLCGFTCSAGFYADLTGAQPRINDAEQISRMPRDLPILLVSGGDDPVGGSGEGVGALAGLYRATGLRDVTCTIYPGARHEILNETNRDQVTADILEWLDTHAVHRDR